MNILHFNCFLIILIATISLVRCGTKYYDGANVPYEFGFTIKDNQHRHETKDANGIISGEFGFVTADGVYHQTVYGTDSDGNFKLVSTKSFKLVSTETQASAPVKRPNRAPKIFIVEPPPLEEPSANTETGKEDAISTNTLDTRPNKKVNYDQPIIDLLPPVFLPNQIRKEIINIRAETTTTLKPQISTETTVNNEFINLPKQKHTISSPKPTEPLLEISAPSPENELKRQTIESRTTIISEDISTTHTPNRYTKIERSEAIKVTTLEPIIQKIDVTEPSKPSEITTQKLVTQIIDDIQPTEAVEIATQKPVTYKKIESIAIATPKKITRIVDVTKPTVGLLKTSNLFSPSPTIDTINFQKSTEERNIYTSTSTAEIVANSFPTKKQSEIKISPSTSFTEDDAESITTVPSSTESVHSSESTTLKSIINPTQNIPISIPVVLQSSSIPEKDSNQSSPANMNKILHNVQLINKVIRSATPNRKKQQINSKVVNSIIGDELDTRKNTKTLITSDKPSFQKLAQKRVFKQNPELISSDMLYKFNYTTDHHGHNEQGYIVGVKTGGYFVVGKDKVRRTVTYTAGPRGFVPSIKFEVLTPDEEEEIEKAKGFEFKWFKKPKENV